MRFLFINKASLRHEGGAEIRARAVAVQLTSLGHDVTVLTAKTNVNEPPLEIDQGIRIYHKKVLPDWLLRRYPAPHYLPLAAAGAVLMCHLYVFLKRERFDVIREDVSPFPPSGLLACARLSPARRIAVVHNLPGTLKQWCQFYGPVYGIAGFIMNSLLRAGMLRYDRILCAAQWFSSELKRHPQLAGRVAHVPNGIDLTRFSSVKPAGDHGRKESPRLLCVGRLVETKGHRYVVEALSHLKARYPRMSLEIVGEGPLKRPLRELARQCGVSDIVQFRAPVGHERMPRLYAEYDYLVLPSLFEGLPLVLLEAMACRLPIIATDIPGVTDVCDAGLATLALSGNAADMADKLLWAFEHPDDVSRKADAALRKVADYDWTRVSQREIEELCADGRNHAHSA